MSPIGFGSGGSRGGPQLDLDIKGLRESGQMLTDVADRGENMRPAMLRIKELLIAGHAEQFASGGSFLGTPWEANAPGTLARKAREGVSSLQSPMVESGDLMESLSGGKGGRSRVSKSGVSVGTSLFYAVFHINPERKGMPARPPVGINEAQRATALAIMERHLMGRGV
jgi:hypothetical protein